MTLSSSWLRTLASHAGNHRFKSDQGHHSWASSSVGRTVDSGSTGRRFDPYLAFHIENVDIG